VVALTPLAIHEATAQDGADARSGRMQHDMTACHLPCSYSQPAGAALGLSQVPHASRRGTAGTCGGVVGEGQVGGGGQVACVCGGGGCVGDEFEQCDALGHPRRSSSSAHASIDASTQAL
jgi:hypothetical protein